jgi:hypothetical protein
MLGDYGFDPLRLGTNSENLKWYREGELYNGRWAMAAVAGILFTDLVGLPKFWLAGAEQYPIDNKVLLAIEVVVMAILEAKPTRVTRRPASAASWAPSPSTPWACAARRPS